MTEMKKRRVWPVFLLMVTLFSLIPFSLCYLSGVAESPYLLLELFLLYLVLTLCFVPMSIVFGVISCLSKKKSHRKSLFLLSPLAFNIGFIIAIGCFVVFPSADIVHTLFLNGYARSVRCSSIDFDGVQKWMSDANIQSEYWRSDEVNTTRPCAITKMPEELLGCLDRYGSSRISFEYLGSHRVVKLEKLGREGDFCGIVIGEADMEMPERFEEISEYQNEWRKQIKPGVYVFSGG